MCPAGSWNSGDGRSSGIDSFLPLEHVAVLKELEPNIAPHLSVCRRGLRSDEPRRD